MKHFKISFILLLFLYNSCEESSVNFYVENKSNEPIDSVTIGLSGFNYKNPITYKEIHPNENINLIYSFKKVPRADGNYKITFFKNRESTSNIFGYYSNGAAGSGNFRATLLVGDSITIEEFFDK